MFIMVLGTTCVFSSCSDEDEGDKGNNNDTENPDMAPDGVQAVDLGLSVKWANMNVGATSPKGYGDYFAQKKDKTSTEDVATKNWGGNWRMPTKSEQDELRTKCTWTWTTLDGVNGYKVASQTNQNSIFLPAAGWFSSYNPDKLLEAGYEGFYLSSSLNWRDDYQAYYICFDSKSFDWGSITVGHFTVRAVCP